MATKKAPVQTPAPAQKANQAPSAVNDQLAKAREAVEAAKAKAAEAKAESQRLAKEARELAKAAKPKKEPRPTCAGTKANGEACTAKAKEGQTLCIDHLPGILRMNNDEIDLLEAYIGELTPSTFVELVGWHKAKSLIGTLPVPKAKEAQEQAAA